MIMVHPKRRVFYSFHYAEDVWRAAQVRKIGFTDHNEPVSENAWEQIKRNGNGAIQQWIDEQMATRSCVVVLIGTHTAERPWIQYEIAKAWNDQKGLLGIHINQLRNQDRKVAQKGKNPFKNIRLTNGQTMDRYIDTYEPPWWCNSRDAYAYIADNLRQWVEVAYRERHDR